MKIILNHIPESFDFEKLTIAKILEVKKYTHHDLILKINGELILNENYKEIEVNEGDNVEIIHLFHGG